LTYGAASFRFDSTIPDSDYLYHTGYGVWDVDPWLNTPGGMNESNTKAATFATLPSLRKVSNEEKRVSDLILSVEEETYDMGAGGTGDNVTYGAITDKYGNAGIWYTNDGDIPSNLYRYYTTALDNLVSGQFYTLTVNTVVNSLYNIGIRLTVGLNEIFMAMHPGENTLVVPFYYTGTNDNLWYNLENLKADDNVSIFRLSIWNGIKDQSGHKLVVHDSAAPTSSDNTINWARGDIVWNTGTDNVGYWQCTVKGSPGTWQAR
jgi:hypothetical protein